MAGNIDTQIRLALKQLIKGLYPDAPVFAWNALSHDLGEWPGMFRTSSGGTHGWIIKRAAGRAAWKNGRRDRKEAIYDVWGFYAFNSGNENDNSDNELSEIVDAIYEAIKAVPTLEVGEVEGHDLLQLEKNTTIETGEETLHFAQCRLCVHLCC
jgi:hypothetical protein